MGVTGSGKSQVRFILPGYVGAANGLQKVIDTLIGPRQNKLADSGLEASTKNISANRVLGHATYGNKLVLVDTPGLNEALEKVSKWMANT